MSDFTTKMQRIRFRMKLRPLQRSARSIPQLVAGGAGCPYRNTPPRLLPFEPRYFVPPPRL